MKNRLITSLLILATTASGVAVTQKANAANEEPGVVSTIYVPADEIRSVVLMAGAAADTEFGYITELPSTSTAEYILPAAGAADDILFDNSDTMKARENALEIEEELVAANEEFNEEFNEEEEDEEEYEYANLALAHVTYDFVNVRSGPGTDYEIVGKMYDGSVAEIIDSTEMEDGLWFHVGSGSVEGYVKAEFFYYDDDLINVIDEHVLKFAVVQVNVLNVREEPNAESDRLGYLTANEKVKVLENGGDWLKVQYTDEKAGYIAAEYVVIEEEYITAKSLEEEKKELEEKRKKEEREREKNAATAVREDVTVAIAAPAVSYASNPELKQALVNYAMQYVGNRYVMGGQSLAGGTDCSGFTCYVYREFGYSIARTPSGQWGGNGRAVSLSEIQVGDIVCYGYGGCSHVALYIGNGQIVHEANSRLGCVVSGINFEPIVGVKRVIE